MRTFIDAPLTTALRLVPLSSEEKKNSVYRVRDMSEKTPLGVQRARRVPPAAPLHPCRLLPVRLSRMTAHSSARVCFPPLHPHLCLQGCGVVEALGRTFGRGVWGQARCLLLLRLAEPSGSGAQHHRGVTQCLDKDRARRRHQPNAGWEW